MSVAGDTLQRALQLDPGSSSCGETAKPYGIKTLLLLVDGLEHFSYVFFFRLNFPSRRLPCAGNLGQHTQERGYERESCGVSLQRGCSLARVLTAFLRVLLGLAVNDTSCQSMTYNIC